MKTSILRYSKKPLILSNVSLPDLQKGQLLIKIAYSGVCHSQLMEARGKRGEDKYLPHLLGHEATGIVEEIGEGVSKVKVGDRVVLGWIAGEGIDAPCPQFHTDDGEVINAGKVTTFSEYSIVSENRVVQLPDDIPLDVGVLFGCAIPTGAGIVLNELEPKPQSTIAIFGLGGIGLSALMATKLFECSKVIAVDVEDNKLELAKSFGATHTINSKRENPLKEIQKLTQGEGVDYSIEASGLVQVIELAFQAVKNKTGLCVFASHPKYGDKINLDPFDLICGKQIRGSWGGACQPDRDLPRFFDLYLKGTLPLEKLFDKTYTLEQINEALDDLEARKVIRPLIKIHADMDK